MDPWSVREGDFPRSGDLQEQGEFLLRYAVLAPSSHNTQPWSFRVERSRIDVYADHSRWLMVADPDQRELYLSVGCALENLIIAAEHFGFAPRVRHLPSRQNLALAASVDLYARDPALPPSRPPELFGAITARHTSRDRYDGRPIPEDLRVALVALVADEGIQVHLADDPTVRRLVDALTLRADAEQFSDPKWRTELAHWLGQGVFGTGWLLSRASQLAVSHLNLGRNTAKKDHELLQSAPLLGLVTTGGGGRAWTIRAGQAFERLFLAAANAGLALQPMNQILQVPAIRDELESVLPTDWGSPVLMFRLGYGESGDRTPRRPVDEVVRSTAAVRDEA
jgi:nitroreductase